MLENKSTTLSNIVLYVICFIIFVSAMATNFESPLRYFKYILFIVLGGLLMLYPIKYIKFDRILVENFLLYGFIFSINLVVSSFNQLISIRFFEEVSLILLPIISVLFISGFRTLSIEDLLDNLFYTYILVFILFFYKDLLNINILINSFFKALRLSTFPTESWMAFPFGLFLIYYVGKKNIIKILIALLFFILCFKRIGFVAFIISYGTYWYLYEFLKLKFNKKRVIQSIVLLNVFLLTNLYLFINGTYSLLIKKYTGITVNHFTQGRFRIYNNAINYFSDHIIFGSSLGVTNLYLKEKFSDIAYLHSDLLKLILEVGLLVFIIWIVCFMIINIRTKESIPIVLYINILFISDNVFIYFDTLFLFYLILILYNRYDNAFRN